MHDFGTCTENAAAQCRRPIFKVLASGLKTRYDLIFSNSWNENLTSQVQRKTLRKEKTTRVVEGVYVTLRSFFEFDIWSSKMGCVYVKFVWWWIYLPCERCVLESIYTFFPNIKKNSAFKVGLGISQTNAILSGIQFTTHFVWIFVVETKRFVGSFVNVILTRQTCGQRSSRACGKQTLSARKFFSRANLLHVPLYNKLEETEILVCVQLCYLRLEIRCAVATFD